MRTKNFKNYITILAIVNYRIWLIASSIGGEVNAKRQLR